MPNSRFPSGGSGSPGGANTDVQYNDNGAFGGESGLTYDKAGDTLTATDGTNRVQVSGNGTIESLKADETGAANLRLENATWDDAATLTTLDDGTLAITAQALTFNGSPIGGITSPLQITGCQLWLDASQIVGLSDGDAVATWADLSGNGYDATQATSDNRPVYKTNIQNALPVVRFTAGDDQNLQLSGAGLGLFRNLSALTIAAVIRNPPGGLAFLSAGIPDGTNPIFDATFSQSDMFIAMYDPSFSDSFGPSMNRYSQDPVLPTPITYTGVLSADMVTTSFGAITTLFNNTGQPVNSATTPHMPDVDAARIVIGNDYLLMNPITADICEVVVYNRALSPRDQRQLYEYLSSKWGTL